MSLDQTYTGLRVLDLSENIAGPLACLILADLGADVVKVERPGTGEATRSLPPRWGPESTVFLTVNRNKRSAALDIATPAGRDAVLRIASDVDVVVESFRPGVAERLGLGFDDFHRVSPHVVHCSVSAFGDGPLGHDRPGYDAIVQAFSGIMEMTGDADGLPARAAPSIVDVSTGLWAITSIQAALARRATEPAAQRLSSTLVDSAFFLLCHQVMGYLGTGEFPGRLGSAAPSTAPYQAFRTADGYIMIAAATDRLFEKLCLALELPDVATDPRYLAVADRVAARDALTAAIEERLATGCSEHWLRRIAAAGVPVGPVNDLATAMAHPVTVERALVRDAESARGVLRIDGLKQLRLPIDTEGACAMREPPALGEHTCEVLIEAGLSPDEISALLPPSSPLAPADHRRAALEARHPTWIRRTTAQLLDAAAARHPDRPLVLGDERTYSYTDIAAWSTRLAAGLLAAGVQPGDHVAVDMANLPEVVALKFAVARVGAVSVSINFMLRHEELGYVLRQSGARLLITMDHFRGLDYLDALDRIAPDWETRGGGDALPRLRDVFVLGTTGEPARGRPLDELVALGSQMPDDEVAARTGAADPDATSDLLYTSGTTGQAKGVMLHHDAVLRTAYASAYTRAFADGRRMLFALPIYHVFGYIEGLVAALFVGGAICPHAIFDAPKALADIARHRIDELICVPAMTTVVLAAARTGEHDLSSLRTMFSSGAAHAPEMWTEMLDVLGVEELFTAYGQTETTASTTCTLPGDRLDRLTGTNGCLKPAGIAGDPQLGGVLAVYKTVHSETGETLPVGEVGELVVRGPIVTRGYHDKPAETAALFTSDGWMRTGDLGKIDDQGYVVLTGRKKESYRCGGELVLPGEIEQVLMDHPGVAAAHVVGIPHARMGEVGCAWIVSGPQRPAEEEVIAYCGSRLARFKVPAVVLYAELEELPVTATGRVQKFVLAQRAVDTLARRSAPVGSA